MQRGNVRLSDPVTTRKSKFEQGFRNELLVSFQNVGQGNEVCYFGTHWYKFLTSPGKFIFGPVSC